MIGILPPLVSASWSIYWTCSESWLQVSCTKRTRLCLIVSPPCSSYGLAIWAFLPVMKTALNGILLKSVRARCFTFSRCWSLLFLSWSKQIFIRCTLSLHHWANWAVWLNAQSLFWISTSLANLFFACLIFTPWLYHTSPPGTLWIRDRLRPLVACADLCCVEVKPSVFALVSRVSAAACTTAY